MVTDDVNQTSVHSGLRPRPEIKFYLISSFMKFSRGQVVTFLAKWKNRINTITNTIVDTAAEMIVDPRDTLQYDFSKSIRKIILCVWD